VLGVALDVDGQRSGEAPGRNQTWAMIRASPFGFAAALAGWVTGHSAPAPVVAAAPEGDRWQEEREAMVSGQLAARGIHDPAVLAAMRRVPRHEFVPSEMRGLAYTDGPLPIGEGQTISQPYIVALMTESAAIHKGSRVLEVGTGSGYQAAVLAELGADVYSIEIVAPLARRAEETLKRLGYRVHVRTGDGYRGWPEAAPFDAVLVTAAPSHVPAPLQNQLKPEGRLVIPVGERFQELMVIRRSGGRFQEMRIAPVRFVPMTGEAQRR
jgi:protein-L-isoaspartate(D-aspartate) O-methyltransferase